jgi:hypothetical protein
MKIKDLLLGHIDGVLVKDNTPYLVIDRGAHDVREAYTDYLLPLLCPVCGNAWHFSGWEGSTKELEDLLSSALEGFEIVSVRLLPQTSLAIIDSVMKNVFFDSGLKPLLVDATAAHPENRTFSAILITLEKWVPIDFDPEKIRSKPEETIRLEYEMEPEETVDELIDELEAIASEGEVEDDMMIVVHIEALLNTVSVEPEIIVSHNHRAALIDIEEEEFDGQEMMNID